MYRHDRRARFIGLVMLGAAAAMMAFMPPALGAATGQGTDQGTGQGEQPVVDAAAGDEAALRKALADRFAKLGGQPEAIANLAMALMASVKGDALARAEAAARIAEVASLAMNALPVYQVAIDRQLTLPKGARGWNFGQAGATTIKGFESVGPGRLGVKTGQGKGKGLMAGVAGPKGFAVDMPDGVYRLILISGASDSANPLGRSLRVNGTDVPIGNAGRDQWIAGASLGQALAGAGAQTAGTPGVGAGTLTSTGTSAAGGATSGATGGATVVTVQIVGGRLVLDFGGDAETFLSAMILEPADGPSILAAPEPLVPPQRILAARETVAQAMGSILEDIAAAVGDDEIRAQILGLSDPVIESTQTVSAN